MPLKTLIAIAVLAALPLLTTAPHAAAQTISSPLARPPAPTYPPRQRIITIYPGQLLYRRCTDWYELQNRPSGTVLYPQMHCWWVRG